jgi:membrane-associated phospholipid phosphatase
LNAQRGAKVGLSSNKAAGRERMIGRNGGIRLEGVTLRKPVAMLINGGTRSGKEILAYGVSIGGGCNSGDWSRDNGVLPPRGYRDSASVRYSRVLISAYRFLFRFSPSDDGGKSRPFDAKPDDLRSQQTLLPFAEQQQQALRDAFITDGDLAELADGLGTTLGSAYLARAHYLDRGHFTSLSQSVADVIAYANATTASDSNAGKYFFANGTTDGKTAVSAEAAAIFKDIGGAPDIFGKYYGRPAGSADADAYGDSRPFQTEPSITRITGPDYFDVPADNVVYNRGPVMNLIDSPSYPSGHTTYGYMGSILLAVLVPERYQQMMARAAEYGNDRILIGAHYAMDVIAGRTLATYDLAHLLANDPAYVGRTLKGAPVIKDFQAVIKQARGDMTTALEAACGKTIAACAGEDTGRLSNPAANAAFYAVTQTYDLPVVHPKMAAAPEDVGKLAPEAGYLLTVAFSLRRADDWQTTFPNSGAANERRREGPALAPPGRDLPSI